MNNKSCIKIGAALSVAIALGLLEAAWTTPYAPGATRPMLGCVAIAVVLAPVCWPRVWWIPGLSMIEELVQIFFGQLPDVRPTLYQALFTHWSASFTWINLYPYITFPLMGILGEALYVLYCRRANQ